MKNKKELEQLIFINQILHYLKMRNYKESDRFIEKYIKNYPHDFTKDNSLKREVFVSEEENIKTEYFEAFFKLSPAEQKNEIQRVKINNPDLYRKLIS